MPLDCRIGFVGINQFNPYLADGVSRATFELLRSLKARGHDVSILHFLTNDSRLKRFIWADPHASESSCPTYPYFSSTSLDGVTCHQTILPFDEAELAALSPATVRQARKSLMSAIHERHLDLVLTCDYSALAVTSAWLAGVRGVHFFHSPSYVGNWAENPVNVQVLGTRTLLAASQFLGQAVRDRLHLECKVVHPLWDLWTHKVTEARERTRVVGYYSSGWHKGDAIVNRLIKLMPDTIFVVVGRNFGGRSDAPSANLRYLDDIVDMREFYSQIAVLVVPSIIPEGFPRMILEAAANGIPAIANRIGGIPEAAGDSGILIAFDPASEPDFDALAGQYVNAINLVLSCEEVYRAYSAQAFHRAAEYDKTQRQLTQDISERIMGG